MSTLMYYTDQGGNFNDNYNNLMIVLLHSLHSTLPHYPGRIVMVPVDAEYGDGDVQVLVLVVHPREPEKSNTCMSHLRSHSKHVRDE